VFLRFTTIIILSALTYSARASFVKIEAESGVLGTDFTNGTDGLVQFISISTDTVNSGNPGNSNRVATYNVTFPTNGTYQLYARVLVGPNGFNDDSMFYGNGFGTKNPTNNSDWILVNGLAGVGFSNATDVVTGGGTLGNGMWKWINLSAFTGQQGFTVAVGHLTQTFQIGARENGLEMDNFVFGTASYTFTVSNLDDGTDGSPPPPPPPSTTSVDSTKTFQTVEGLGGAIAFYNGWVTAHPYKLEIFTNAFAGLNLSMFRLGDWFRYQGTTSFDPDAPGFVYYANRVLGHSVPVYMSSWAPPGFLKSNGQVGNGGTLLFTNGSFAYTNFAQYWYDSLQAYGSNGISPTWISIQNEPDWAASYDSCVFHPTEDTVNGTNYASYSKALDATYQRLTNLPAPPKLLGPECVGIGFNDVQNYAATMNSGSFYGVAHHLYGGSSDGTPDGYNANLAALTNVFPSKPRFMTEYGLSDMIQQANLIHNVLTVEQASGYNYWSLVWPVTQNSDGTMNTDGGLVQIENPFNQSSWTNAPPGTTTESHGWWLKPAYWAMKHFSYFIQPGFRRVAANCTDTNVLTSAYISPDGFRLVVVIINRNLNPATNNVTFGSFPYSFSNVYQTAGTNYFQTLGPVGSTLILPASSLTTIVLDQLVAVGPATNPSPALNATGIPFNAPLNWTPGGSAWTHAVYLGTGSNAVAQATPASPQFMGNIWTNTFCPALAGGTTYFWRVDEVTSANTNTGVVWSFTTAPLPSLVHEYSFSENGGLNLLDSMGGPAWAGVLPNYGTFANGQLVLASGSQQYGSLPAGIVATLTNFTIETWVKVSSAVNWNRIFDFGNGTTTYMFLTPQNGSTGKIRFAITTSGGGGEQQISGTSALVAGVWYHVAVTRNGNTGVLYVNGVAVGTNSAMTLSPSSLGSTVNNYLGRSQFSADPYFNGALDEFRIYSVALSPSEIAATDAMGPNQLLSTNSPYINVASAPTSLTLTWPLASAGFTVQSTTNLTSSSWANVSSPLPQIVSGQWQIALPTSASSNSIFYRLIK
jgi:glucuronoarabinoxylan endo-1,4-beta-xylanase